MGHTRPISIHLPEVLDCGLLRSHTLAYLRQEGGQGVT